MVEVDNGYIWITPLNGTDPSKPGVRIRTSKQERVQGLSPTATAALGCLLGWGTYANDVLSGTASMVLSDPSIPTQPFVLTVLAGDEKLSGVGKPVRGPAQLPPDFGHAMGDVRNLLTHHIERSRKLAAKAGERWLDGMTRDDVKEITKEFGKHLEKFAVEAYKTAESNVKPQVTPERRRAAPMDDPRAIATRYATITRKMVNDATQVAIDAFNKINGSPGKYKGKDAIKSMTKLADIAITGGSALARIPLQIQPDNGPMLVADEVASVVQRALTDAAAVAGDVAKEVNAGTFKTKWVDSAVKLTSIAVLRAAEAAEAIGAGPGVLADPVMTFGPYPIAGANTWRRACAQDGKAGPPRR